MKRTPQKKDFPPPPDIILVRPQLGENIGTAARALHNFAFKRLHLVAPRPAWSRAKAQSAAAGGASILERRLIHEKLEDALASFRFVLATSARPRALAKPVLNPEKAISELLKNQKKGKTAILFGPERTGLSNHELDLCDAIVTIPANPLFPSLNLAQSVLLLAYLWHQKTQSPQPPKASQPPQSPASKKELLDFFLHLERELDAVNHFHPPERRDVMIRQIRTLFLRGAPSGEEIRALRGIISGLARRPRKR